MMGEIINKIIVRAIAIIANFIDFSASNVDFLVSFSITAQGV